MAGLNPSEITSIPGLQHAMAEARKAKEEPTPERNPEEDPPTEERPFTREAKSGVKVKGRRNIGQERHAGKSVLVTGRNPKGQSEEKPGPIRSPSAKSRQGSKGTGVIEIQKGEARKGRIRIPATRRAISWH